jgi:hypothetical protein
MSAWVVLGGQAHVATGKVTLCGIPTKDAQPVNGRPPAPCPTCAHHQDLRRDRSAR